MHKGIVAGDLGTTLFFGNSPAFSERLHLRHRNLRRWHLLPVADSELRHLLGGLIAQALRHVFSKTFDLHLVHRRFGFVFGGFGLLGGLVAVGDGFLHGTSVLSAFFDVRNLDAGLTLFLLRLEL